MTILADSSSSAIVWSLVLVAIVAVGFLVVLKVKRWVNAPELPASGGGFTLSDLRRMHKEGRMTDAEFEKAKMLIVGAAKAPRPASDTELKPPSGRSPQL